MFRFCKALQQQAEIFYTAQSDIFMKTDERSTIKGKCT